MSNKLKWGFIFSCLLGLTLQAQVIKPLHETKWPESDPDAKFYTVQGFRHGISFFPKVKYSHVQYEPGATVTFDKFHSADVVYYWMEKWAKEKPDLVEVYEVAHSYEGRPILQMTLTNKKTGKPTDKPAGFFEGNRHSGEVSSTEATFWMMWYLIENYGKDPEVTTLLDKNTIYLRPINNPDGHNLYMHTAQSNRSTVRPYDNDGDGLLDEDSPEDIDGDGLILRMRYKDSEKGDYNLDPRDSRLMVRVPVGEGEYCVIAEGIDNDGDGRINEDGIGGLDLHRNYVENWRPAQEMTGRGVTQANAGEYPLSEIETRSVVTFLLSHPHVSVVNSMDTQAPFHLHAPSTAKMTTMFPEDMKLYLQLDELGMRITGYPKAGDVIDYNGGPIHGHGPDFGYWYYGAIWYGDEIWNGGRLTEDYNKDGVVDELDRLYWDDHYNDGIAFKEWTKTPHPTLGEVEIGGWDPKFFSQNAPSREIEKWAKNQALFNIEMLKSLPSLEWGDIEIKRVKAYKNDSTDYQVKVSYKNTGVLPTALRQADHVKIVRPDQVQITLPMSDVTGESPKAKIIQEAPIAARGGRGMGMGRPANVATQGAGYTDGGKTNAQTFTIRIYGGQPIEGKATVSSTRGGILPEKTFVIK